MQTSTLTEILMTKLECGYSDLEMLDYLYTDLAEDCVDVDEIVSHSNDLNDILYNLYYGISSKVQDELFSIVEDLEEIEIEIKGFFEVIKLTDELKEFILKIANNLYDNLEPFCNYLDTHFQNVLDNTCNWSCSARRNAEMIIEQELKHLTDDKLKDLVHLVDEEE